MINLALHFLAKMKVLAVKDTKHEDIEVITEVTTMRIVNNT